MHATWNFFIEPSYFIILKISADDLICGKDSAIFAAGAEFTDCGSGPNLNAGCDVVAKFFSKFIDHVLYSCFTCK